MKKDILVERITDLVDPIVKELNYELYHLEYVKENNEYYLRIYIDKEGQGIDLSDCEKVSRKVSEMLDIEDPIEDSYYLEVSSPGLNRGLHKKAHFERFIGSIVLVKLLKKIEGKKQITGILDKVDDVAIYIKEDEEYIEIALDIIKSANIEGEI